MEADLDFLVLGLGFFGEEWGVAKGELEGEALGEFAGVEVTMRDILLHLVVLSLALWSLGEGVYRVGMPGAMLGSIRCSFWS